MISHLIGVVQPLAVNVEFVLVLALREIHNREEIPMAET